MPLQRAAGGLRSVDPDQIASANEDGRFAARIQEPGVRSSCAIPYELYADHLLEDDSDVMKLRLSVGNRSFGSTVGPWMIRSSMSKQLEGLTYLGSSGSERLQAFRVMETVQSQ